MTDSVDPTDNQQFKEDDSMSSSDDDDMDEGCDLNDQELKEVENLKQILESDPYDYQSYVSLINLLRRAGELDQLRAIRNSFAKYFPLTPELWLAWISDEQKVATTEIEKKHVEGLFRQAVEDYTSVDVWLEFCQFSLTRDIFEEAIVHVGVHATKGSLIWDAYREFENFSLMVNPKNTEQVKVVDKIFRRQLAVPLLNMESTYEEYKKWHADTNLGNLDPNVERSFKAAKEILRNREAFENKLMQAKENNNVEISLQVYKEYIEIELKDGNPPRIQSIFERRITDHCLHPSNWFEYTNYLETLNLDHAKKIHTRAIRNCPWSGKLWIKLIRSCEKSKSPLEEVRKHMEAALASVSETEYRDLWLSFIDYRRRGMKLDEEEEEEKRENEIQEFRTIFNRALEQLAQLDQPGDPDCKIARYWASIEADRFQSMEEARGIWSKIIKGPCGDNAKFWIEYINLEKLFGDTKHLKKLFPRALESSKDWPEEIGEIWMQFEREEGSLESFEEAEIKVNKRLEAIKATRAKKEDEENGKIARKKERDKDKRREKRHQESNDRKRKFQTDEKSPLVESAEPEFKKPALPPFLERKEKTKESATINPPPGFIKKTNQINPPPGFKSVAETTNSNENQQKIFEHNVEVPKDERTVFLSNLDFNVDEDLVKQTFSKCGEILEFNVIKNFSGKSKGFGFMEFKTAKAAINALQMDNVPIKGRPVYVSVNDPEKKNKGHQFQYSTNLEKNKLFIKGIASSVTKEDIEELFSPFGTLKAVRLPLLRNGHPKGIAYLEFENEASAKKAIMEMDNREIKGLPISVAISNPPPKKDKQPLRGTPIQSLGGGSNFESLGPRGRGRTQLSFVPRSVQNSTSSQKTSTNGSAAPTKTMSNTDFRNMLLQSKK